MYLPPAFAEDRIELMHELIAAQPLATLVTLADGEPVVDLIPFLLDAGPTPQGTLRGHIARANPLWRTHPADREALAVFAGPQAYISPGWYASKAEHGRVVPTWNYAVVEARGPLRVIDDADWLLQLVGRLSDRHEAVMVKPWRVADAPPEYVAQMLKAIVGIEIPITRLTGKWKTSQNRPAADRAGVVAGLTLQAGEDAAAMARLVARHDAKE